MKYFDIHSWLDEENDREHELETSHVNYSPSNSPNNKNYNNSTAYNVDVVLKRISYHHVDLTQSYADWLKLGFAFSNEFGEFGRDYFHRASQEFPKYNAHECNLQFDKCLKRRAFGNTIKTFFWMAKNAGIDILVEK